MDRAGKWQDTSIDLNDGIANIDGVLKWRRGGNFIGSSQNVYLNVPILSCESRTTTGYYRSASINLDEMISNDNGKLICGLNSGART